MDDLDTIKNFGPYMVRIMREIGIRSREDLMAADYRSIRRDLEKKGIKAHLNIFYSIEMGLQDRIWHDITPGEKQEIRKLLNG